MAQHDGEEQYEWYKAFMEGGRVSTRIAATVGLRGTDLNRLTTDIAVRDAAMHSPSLARRRPENHAVAAANWVNEDDVARALDFADF